MKVKRLLTAVCSAALMLSAIPTVPPVQAEAASQTITNDCFWKDTSGKNIYSQGGGVFKFGDTYYWYGVHYTGADKYAASPTGKNGECYFQSVTCYSSKDLVNWKFENDVLTGKTKNIGMVTWFGRLGAAYCPKSRKYIICAQYNGSVLFAQCDTPTGNFEIGNVQEQIPGVVNTGTGDQTLFVDDDGQAYLICSSAKGRSHQYVCKLRESDFLAAERAVEVKKGSGKEGNCMFKYKNKYYFCASDLHGWNASHSYYMVADNINGPYSDWKVMDGTDNDFSHVTQTGFFYTVKGSKQETVIFCGDRWSDFAGNGLGYNQWVPLTVNGNDVKFNSLSEWNLDAQTGEWSVGAGNNYVLNPTFEADRVSQSTLAGWKVSGTGNGNRKGGHTGNWCAQQYGANAFSANMSQDIALPNGNYTLKFWVRSSGGQKSAKVYVKNYGGAEMSVSANKNIGNWTQMSIDNIPVTDGKIQVGFASDGNAGNWLMVDDFSLVGNGQPAPPPESAEKAEGRFIKNLSVNDTANAANWSVQTEPMQAGSTVFGDRAFKFTSVPKTLSSAEWIRTACDSKKYAGDEATFTAGGDLTAYIVLDTRVNPLPAWLSGWTKASGFLTDDGNPQVTYQLYRKDFRKNETVTLGALAQSSCVNYLAAVTEQGIGEPGDINADGVCDKTDLVMLRDYLLTTGTLTQKQGAAADMNGDGKINAADLTLLKQMLLQAMEKPRKYATGAALMADARKELLNQEPASSTAEIPGVQYGTYKRETIYSNVCKRNKSFNVLLPAGYSASKKYPVLYILHGYGGDEFTMTEMGDASLRIRFIIGNAIAAGEAEDMIVVFPDVYASATQDKCSGMDNANNAAYDNFINLLTKEIMPFMEQNYPIKTGPENTAITGGSMGGREAMYIGFKRPDLFGYIGAMCPAPGVAPGLIGADQFRFGDVKPYLLMITGGSDDTVVYGTPGTYHDLLDKNGVDHVWHYVIGGDHVGRSIRPHMFTFVRYLFKAGA